MFKVLDHQLSSTPVPAALQCCRQTRNLGLYKRIFSEVDAQEGETEQRYVWLNLDIDMIDIGKSGCRLFDHIAADIKLLKFERDYTDEYFYHVEAHQLSSLSRVEEIHVICTGGFWNWGGCINDESHFLTVRNREVNVHQEAWGTNCKKN